jgi:hypothetical protein
MVSDAIHALLQNAPAAFGDAVKKLAKQADHTCLVF